MIGAGIAVLTGIGAGFGIGIATSKAAEAIAQGTAAGLCSGRSNRYLRLRCCTADGNYELRPIFSEPVFIRHVYTLVKTGSQRAGLASPHVQRMPGHDS